MVLGSRRSGLQISDFQIGKIILDEPHIELYLGDFFNVAAQLEDDSRGMFGFCTSRTSYACPGEYYGR